MFDYGTLKNWDFPDVEFRYGPKDVILYALSLGLGQDPTDESQLRFVYEKNLHVLPGFALGMGHPGPWIQDARTGITWQQVLNAGHEVELFAPVPVAGCVRGKNKIVEIVDKGREKGALIHLSREIVDCSSNVSIGRVAQTLLCRADGGFGSGRLPGSSRAPAQPSRPTDAKPDQTLRFKTLPNAALLFRLTGDLNPLHADPTAARAAGFERPILHGAALFGIATALATQALCSTEPHRLRGVSGRFSAPVFPGETICGDFWKTDEGNAKFRLKAAERDVVVFDGGFASLVEAYSGNNRPADQHPHPSQAVP